MATFTPNYNLRKPADEDHPDPDLDIGENLDKLDAHAHSGTYVPTVTDEAITTITDGTFTTMGPSAGEFFKLAVFQSADSPTVSPANNGGYGAAFYAVQRLRNTVADTPNGHFFGDGILAMLQLVSLDLSAVSVFAGISGIETDVRIGGTGTDIPNLNGNYVVPILAGEAPPAGTVDLWAGVHSDTAQGDAHASGLTVARAIGGFFKRPFRDNDNVTVTEQSSLYAQEGQVFEIAPSGGTDGWFGLRNREDGLSFWVRVVDQKLQVLNNDGSLAMFQVDSNGVLSAYNGVRLSGFGGHTSGSKLLSGSAAPDDGDGANGDYYFRSGAPGTPNQRMYVKTNSVWAPIDPRSDALTSGEAVFDRTIANNPAIAMTSQLLRLSYFTAQKTETINSVRVTSGSVAAGATPSLVRLGVWTTDDTGALLASVATTANDTALLAGLTTRYTKAFSASFTKQAGQRYAAGLLVVTAATAPQVVGAVSNLSDEMAAAPRLCANVAGQADLPSTVAAGSLSLTGSRLFFSLIP